MAATDLMEKTEILSAVTEGIFPDGPFRAARVGGLEVRSHFQAVFDAKSLAVVGHEALLRANFSGARCFRRRQRFMLLVTKTASSYSTVSRARGMS